MAESWESILTKIDTAIGDVLNGRHASYSIAGRSVQKLDLGQLLEWKRQVEKIIERQSSGGIFRGAKITKALE
jgi:hypothetical protein